MAVHEARHAFAAACTPHVTVTRTGLSPELGQLCSGAGAGFTHSEGRCPWPAAAVIGPAGEQARQRWLREQCLDSDAGLWATEVIARRDRQDVIGQLAPAGVTVTYGYDGVKAGPDGGVTVDWWYMRLEAARVVAAGWEQVLRLGEAIARRGELAGEEAARLTGQPGRRRAQPAQDPWLA